MTPPPGRASRAPTLIVLDARVLRELPMTNAPANWPTAEQVAVRLGLAADVTRSSLRRLDGRYLAEHDGGRPRRWARTARGEQALEWEP
jgi:hypothetical protein